MVKYVFSSISKLFISFTLTQLFSFISSETEKIHFAFEIFRHGARAPFTGVVDGKDCYGYSWPGTSELSYIGRRMHYLLGAHNRKRYVGTLLSESYTQSEIYVISTDVNRTLESVSSQLQGLYPSGTGPKLTQIQQRNAFPPNTNYTVDMTEEANNLEDKALPNLIDLVPIHTFDVKKHTFQLHDKNNCPGAEKAYTESLGRKEISDFIKKLNEKYGKQLIKFEKEPKEDFLSDYWTTYKYMDAFIANRVNGESMKPLTDLDINLDEFEKYALEFLWLDYLGTNFNNYYLARVSMTHTMKEVLRYMENIKNNTEGVYYKPKFVMYSAHDTTIGAFEVFNHLAFNTKIEYAKFAENCFYELYTKKDGAYYVRYLMKDQIKFDITFEDFKKGILKNILSDDEINDYCDFNGQNWKKSFIISTYVLAGVVVLLGVLVVILCIKKRSRIEPMIDNVSPLTEGIANV